MNITNPILPGFNPDPSLLRVGKDYYIATSTFEWFPGVCIYHSKDLVNWKIISYALNDEKILDMKGIDSSCGIWAPNLTYSDGLFYLAYTIVYTDRSRYKDTYNFLITAPDVKGPWSEPIELNCSGFDPSIFHDDDGKKYVVNMTMDHRSNRVRFSGIDVQEFDTEQKKMVGEPIRITRGTKYGITEGPNIVKHDGYYYLFLAEGGTEFSHCTTMLRAKDIKGPYEENPHNPIMFSKGQENCKLKRAGHAQVMQDVDGNWYMAHLCGRPVDDCSILGRETSIQNVEWKDGWCKISANDCAKPEETFSIPFDVERNKNNSEMVDFKNDTIPLSYMTLRQSFATNGVSIKDGKLHIVGGCSPLSKYGQAMIARRQQAFNCDFETKMKFVPRGLNHMAGMLVYYNYDNHYYLKLSKDEKGIYLSVCSIINREMIDSKPVYLEKNQQEIYLKAEIRTRELQYYYSIDGKEWKTAGESLDMRNISDERIAGNGFTGSMLGVNCCDCQGDRISADFYYLNYREY